MNAEPLSREALPPIPPALLARPHDACDRRIAELETQLAALDDHFAAAQYGCPNCGVHHGCIEMVERNLDPAEAALFTAGPEEPPDGR